MTIGAFALFAAAAVCVFLFLSVSVYECYVASGGGGGGRLYYSVVDV